jgi:hypothetical protein
MYVCMYVCMCVNTHTQMLNMTPIFVYIHTYIHAQMLNVDSNLRISLIESAEHPWCRQTMQVTYVCTYHTYVCMYVCMYDVHTQNACVYCHDTTLRWYHMYTPHAHTKYMYDFH